MVFGGLFVLFMENAAIVKSWGRIISNRKLRSDMHYREITIYIAVDKHFVIILHGSVFHTIQGLLQLDCFIHLIVKEGNFYLKWEVLWEILQYWEV